MEICIDGGGSSTRVLVTDGESFSKSSFGPTNFRYHDHDSLESFFDEITEHFNLNDIKVDRVLCGFSGAGNPVVVRKIESALSSSKLHASEIEVLSDLELALRAMGENGLILISGTGSICGGRLGEKLIRAGGHGYLKDEGSGFYMGRRLLNAYFNYCDNNSYYAPIFEHIPKHLNFQSLSEFNEALLNREGQTVKEVASLSIKIMDWAAEDDRLCTKIVEESKEALGDLVQSVIFEIGGKHLEVGLMGGLFSHFHAMRLLICDMETRFKNLGYSVQLSRLGIDTEDPLILALKSPRSGAR